MILGSRAAFTPVLLTCYSITLAVHVGSIGLSTLLPFRMMAVGDTSTQVGLLFSVMTVVSMVLRPTIGAWVDRLGARPIGHRSIAINVLAIPHAVEEHGRSLDVVADSVVADPDAPLTDRNADEFLATLWVVCELLDGPEHAAVDLDVERLEVAPKLRREGKAIARLGSGVAW